ncbi:hypothetical protein [Streptomyces sp. NPDC050164]|uniref:hypothetical protein n=1 Tax=Streptomyces sp. NPDC050164 TaxID=3365605 RepID=UPI0037987D25
MSDAFSIRVVSVSPPAGSEAGGGAVGRITVREFEESFPMDLTYWSVEKYRASWSQALRVLERRDDATSCLISSITDPSTSNFVFCWPLYRSQDLVYVQDSIIFLEGLDEDFDPDEPWRFVEPRSTVAEEGHEISEWQTTVDEVRDFLHRV